MAQSLYRPSVRCMLESFQTELHFPEVNTVYMSQENISEIFEGTHYFLKVVRFVYSSLLSGCYRCIVKRLDSVQSACIFGTFCPSENTVSRLFVSHSSSLRILYYSQLLTGPFSLIFRTDPSNRCIFH